MGFGTDGDRNDYVEVGKDFLDFDDESKEVGDVGVDCRILTRR